MNTQAIAMGLLVSMAPIASHAFDRKDAELAMTQAGTAVQAAESADAAQYATPDLATAHDMLTNAQAEYDHHHWTESVFNAENAKADADLATARSREHRAEDATAEVERSLVSLRQQLGISSNGGQP